MVNLENKTINQNTVHLSEEVNNYLTTIPSTVKMDMYKTVFNGLLC